MAERQLSKLFYVSIFVLTTIFNTNGLCTDIDSVLQSDTLNTINLDQAKIIIEMNDCGGMQNNGLPQSDSNEPLPSDNIDLTFSLLIGTMFASYGIIIGIISLILGSGKYFTSVMDSPALPFLKRPSIRQMLPSFMGLMAATIFLALIPVAFPETSLSSALTTNVIRWGILILAFVSLYMLQRILHFILKQK